MQECNIETLKRFIACINRELTMRRKVYPKWIIAGRLKSDTAAREINTMQEILNYFTNEYEQKCPKVQMTLFDNTNYKKTIKHYER